MNIAPVNRPQNTTFSARNLSASSVSVLNNKFKMYTATDAASYILGNTNDTKAIPECREILNTKNRNVGLSEKENQEIIDEVQNSGAAKGIQKLKTIMAGAKDTSDEMVNTFIQKSQISFDDFQNFLEGKNPL